MPHERLALGCMTGTSMDGLDAALVRLTGRGRRLRARFLAGISRSLGPLAAPLRAIAGGDIASTGSVPELAQKLAALHVRVIRDLLRRADVAADRVALIAVHGQTLFHQPPLSWQLVNPMPIAHALGRPVVFDLRGADLAWGGQGAPITPMADHVLFRHPRRPRVVVNFGGFINYTILPPPSRALQGRIAPGIAPGSARPGGDKSSPDRLSAIAGGDLCACNQLLDAIARDCMDVPFDRGGRRALAGRVDAKACATLARQLQRQAQSGRSLGTGDETPAWLAKHRNTLASADLARTACAAIARTLVDVVTPSWGEGGREGKGEGENGGELIVAGGGARNAALLAEIRDRLPQEATLTLSDDLGVPLQFREAIAMAVLGVLSQDRVPITLPRVTGLPGSAPVAGAWVWP